MQKFSVAITTYNRFDLTIKSIEQVLHREEISEFVIYDDGSDVDIVTDLIVYYNEIGNDKVEVISGNKNVGMACAKKNAVICCEEDYVILFDSDNELTNEYIDAVSDLNRLYDLDKGGIILCPSFARPNFDYRELRGQYVTAKNAKELMPWPMFGAMMNTCNYAVPRKKYLDVWQPNPEIKGTDTLWFNYLWLKAGNCFFIVDGMEYNHLVHEGSTFMQDVAYNMQKAKEIEQLIREL